MLFFLEHQHSRRDGVQTSNIDSSRFHEISKLRKWGIGQESIKGLAKTQLRLQRGRS